MHVPYKRENNFKLCRIAFFPLDFRPIIYSLILFHHVIEIFVPCKRTQGNLQPM